MTRMGSAPFRYSLGSQLSQSKARFKKFAPHVSIRQKHPFPLCKGG